MVRYLDDFCAAHIGDVRFLPRRPQITEPQPGAGSTGGTDTGKIEDVPADGVNSPNENGYGPSNGLANGKNGRLEAQAAGIEILPAAGRALPDSGGHTAGEHHHLIDLPEIEVDTGATPIPPDERIAIEAEAPTMARPVEDIAEDRSWLSHKVLRPRTIVSFILAIGIIVFIFTRLDIDPGAIWQNMTQANPWLLVTAFLVYYSAFWLRGARWKQLLLNIGLKKEEEAKLPNVNGLVEMIYLSWFVNCIVPAKLGDAYRSYLLKRNSGVSFSSTIGTILAERVIDLLVLFGLLAASFTLVQQRLASSKEFDLGLVMIVGALMVVGLVVALVGLKFFGNLMLRVVPGRFKSKFVSFRQGILRSFKRRTLPMLLASTIAIWCLEGGRLFFVTRSLDAHDVTLSAVIFIALLSSLLTTLPLTPGGAGVVEGAVTLALGLFLKNHQLALSIALLDRLINYWSLIAGGLVLYIVSKRR